MKPANDIKVIFFSSTLNSAGGRQQRVIEMLFTKEQIEAYRTIDTLQKRLHQPLVNPYIFVILASSAGELLDIVSLQEILKDRRIILVLPDGDPETIAQGHSLRPRFLTCVNSDFVEVLAVLGKMAGP